MRAQGAHLQRQRVFIVSLFLLALALSPGYASASQACYVTFNSSNQSYSIANNYCSQVSLVFARGVSNSGVVCSNATIGSGSTIVSGGGNSGVYLRNCTISNPSITLANGTSMYIMGADNPVFSPTFLGSSSNITVMHWLRVNVFEPFGYNTSAFGSRAAGFSYIFPLFNHTFSYSNTELQMSEFFDSRFNNLSAIRQSVPVGAYNTTQSDIQSSYQTTEYGQIKGSKVFAISDYTLSKKGMVRYNPYEVDYSFLAYDQLVMYTINVTRNMNLTPMYIQPIYPRFNFNIIPDNGTRSITIRYVVAIPPQDSGWNFTDYLYRYDPAEFVTNPVSGGVGPRSALYNAFSRPGSAPNYTANGTAFYFINYTTPIQLGINSSIMTAQGTIPGLGSFIQDSTTPSFSFGLGFCALANDLVVPMPNLTMNRTGVYHMVQTLQPIAQPAIPGLVKAACTVGSVITGNNIEVDCGGGTINDTVVAMKIVNSNNINVRNCRIVGNGVNVVNSGGVSFSNMTFEPSNARDFAVEISDAHGVNFYNISIGNGYNNTFSVFSSTGTPFSEGVEIYNLSMCGQGNITALRQSAFIYSYRDTCASAVSQVLSINPLYGLAALTLVLAAAYAYIFLMSGRSHGKRSGRRGGRGR